MLSSGAPNDPLLSAVIAAGVDERTLSIALGRVMDDYAGPFVEQALRGEVERGGLSEADAADLESEIKLRLLRRLRRLARQPADPIGRLAEYLRATIHSVVEDHRQRRDPLRRRLAIRVRYVLTHTRGLALWGREPLCGVERWAGCPGPIVHVVLPIPVARSSAEDSRRLRRVLRQALQSVDGPVLLESLVAALAAAIGLPEVAFVSADDELGDLVDPTEPSGRLAKRELLEELWREIANLPVPQRQAVLLQVRTSSGDSVARLLTTLGLADVRTLARTLELPLAELIGLWNRLPLDDQAIAARCGLERQQVINLRKAARERLARHMGRPRREERRR